MPEGPQKGIVTFLSTGISARTADPGAWHDPLAGHAEARELHDRVPRTTIERHGGRGLTAGSEGLAAAFSTAGDAAAAAVACQQLLVERDPSFRIRMGLHTGEATVGGHPLGDRDLGDDLDVDLHRAARLMSLAHPGQVLVSGTTEALLRDRRTLRPLGEHRLRGLRGRIGVHQPVAEELPSEFPVLQAPGDLAGHLPR